MPVSDGESPISTSYFWAPSTGSQLSTSGVGYVTVSPSFGAVGVGADEDLSHSVEDDQAPETPVAETARTRQ